MKKSYNQQILDHNNKKLNLKVKKNIKIFFLAKY